MRTVRDALKSLGRGAAIVCVSPLVALYYLKALVIGRDRALEGSSQSLALLPGLPGRYLRVAFLRCVLEYCDASAAIEFGTVFSQAAARIGANVYIGPRCHIGWAHIGPDALIAAGVHIPSGPATHGIADPDTPIREQPGSPKAVRIGANCWIGSAAVVMADVGAQSVVGAGSVVINELPPLVIAGGVPSRVIRERVRRPEP